MDKSVKKSNTISSESLPEHDFEQIKGIIEFHRSRASREVNEESLMMSWRVGKYISEKLRSNEWGSKVVMQLSEYLRTKDPDLKGYSRRNLYNMVNFHESYSSPEFQNIISRYGFEDIVQFQTAQLSQATSAMSEIVQFQTAQFPKVLTMTTFTNHITILANCKTSEERLFYILYAHRERLKNKELVRCIENGTYISLLRDKKHLSAGLKDKYVGKPMLFKDTAFVDFLNLPKKHNEKLLHKGLLEHMKQFVLELGKDFLFVDSEYPITVGSSTFKIDLLFYHRGLRCLVAMELKSKKFKPADLGQLEFYLEALDRDVKRSDENPSIGILLCQTADSQVVEYAMNRSMSPTLITQYKRMLIPQEVLQRTLDEYVELVLNK